jgi:hypothetical protein
MRNLIAALLVLLSAGFAQANAWTDETPEEIHSRARVQAALPPVGTDHIVVVTAARNGSESALVSVRGKLTKIGYWHFELRDGNRDAFHIPYKLVRGPVVLIKGAKR